MLEKQPPLGLSPGFSRYSEVSTATAPTDPFPILTIGGWGVLQRPQRRTHTLTGVYVVGEGRCRCQGDRDGALVLGCQARKRDVHQ